MTRTAPSSPSLRWLRRQLQRHGSVRLNLVLSAGAVVVAGGAGAASALLAEHGRPLLAAGVAGAVCALLAPWLVALALRLLQSVRGPVADVPCGGERDELTGVLTRHRFIELAEREFARCRRYQMTGALMLIDADHFKRINDAHGHRCGDAVLREITRLAMDSLRQPDLLARFGGEELIVFLPHTDPLGAIDVADRIRERVSELRLRWQGADVQVTVSIGVAALEAGHANLDALILDADKALFAAKDAGRNCVRAAPIEPRRSGESRSVTARRR